MKQFHWIVGECSGITTDGESRIWFLRQDTPTSPPIGRKVDVATGYYYEYTFPGFKSFLYEFNTQTKSVKELFLRNTTFHFKTKMYWKYFKPFPISYYYFLKERFLTYNSSEEKLYFIFPLYYCSEWKLGYGDNSDTEHFEHLGPLGDDKLRCYDLNKNSMSELAEYNNTKIAQGQFVISEGNFLYVGNGYDTTPIYPGFKAFSNNILYLSTEKGIYKCPFFSKIPADAPIVAKIYKGERYWALEPFDIPNKISFKRTPQIATEDIEIKMYEYDAVGEKTIYIETL